MTLWWIIFCQNIKILADIYGGTISLERFVSLSLTLTYSQWEAPWKTFAEALLDILEVKHIGLIDVKMTVLKHLLGSTSLVTSDWLLGASESGLVTLEKFSQILEWFGPLQKTAITLNYIFDIASKPYFWGVFPTEQCEALLSRQKKGTYLLRFNRKVPG